MKMWNVRTSPVNPHYRQPFLPRHGLASMAKEFNTRLREEPGQSAAQLPIGRLS